MPAFNEITPLALMRLIGTPNCPTIIDVTTDDDFAADPLLIPTATRHAYCDLQGIGATVGHAPAVIVCQKGKKLSHGVASYLRARGGDAQVLTGGNLGWAAAALPRVPAAKIPASLWVTRHRPKIDRIACPWLITRFVDPAATFLFVPPTEVRDVAERFDATPFDIPDTFWSHRGPRCTFDTMVAEFGLSHPALDVLAQVVRAADTDQHDLAPQAAGLLALSVGMSRLYRNDAEQLAACLPIYDALYRWARDGQDEGHDWQGGSK